MKIEELSIKHQYVWNTLKMLDDGERILGSQLQARGAISTHRKLFLIIEDLRRCNFLVGSSKQKGSSGYFEIRDTDDLDRTLRSLRDTAETLRKTAKQIELAFYKQQFKKGDNTND